MLKIILHNTIKSWKFITPDPSMHDSFSLRSMSIADSWNSIKLYREAFPGERYGFLRSLFLLSVSRRFSVCAVNKSNEVIGFEYFRLGKRDIHDGTVHESFIGVSPQYRGKGVATCMRKYAMRAFYLNGFQGISSKIVLSNISSLRSSEKVGFQIIEHYTNGDGVVEAYLIAWLDESREIANKNG